MKFAESVTLNQTKTSNPDQAESYSEGDVAPNTTPCRNTDISPMSNDGTRVDDPEISEKSDTTKSSHLLANELFYDTLTCLNDICHGIFA